MPFLPAEPGTEDKLLPHPPFLTVGSFDWARHTFKPLCACMLSHARLFLTPWTVAHQAPLSMGLSRQEYWSRLPCLPPGDLPDPEIKPVSPALQTNSLPLSHLGSLCPST